MRSVLLRLLVLFLAPVLVITSPSTAQAVNPNPWETTNLNISRGFVGDHMSLDIDCQITARYTGDGLGMQWAESTCVNGFDTGIPGATDEPPEPGTTGELIFRGARAGAAGGDTWTGLANCGATTAPYATRVLCKPGSPDMPGTAQNAMYVEVPNPYPGTTNTQMCQRRTGTTTYGTTPYYEAVSFPGVIPEGHRWYVFASRSSSAVYEWDIDMFTTQATNQCQGAYFNKEFTVRAAPTSGTWTPPESDAPPGSGAGDLCEAVTPITMGASDADSWTQRAGTLAAGTSVFGASPSGQCVVTQVCIDFESMSIGCTELNLGNPILPGGSDPDVPDTDAPPAYDPTIEAPADEPSFWQQILGALRTLFKVMGKGFGLVVDALGHVVTAVGTVASAILDGVAALFVPPEGLFDDGTTQLRESLGDSNLSLWQDQYEDGMDAALNSADGGTAGQGGSMARVASSNCQGPGVTWHYFEDVGLNGSGTIHPFAACSGTSEEMAGWSRLLLTAFIGVGAVLKIMQMILQSIGLQKQIDALNFDWSGATHYKKGYPD